MNTSAVEIMNRGMDCLTKCLGIIETEYFISTIIREKFDYTVWQRQYFDSFAPGEFHEKAVNYAKSHPYTGKAERI